MVDLPAVSPRPRRLLLLLLALFGPGLAATARGPVPAEPPRLSVGDAVVLGVVEGVTEFLPISSTGHLIIANELLGLNSAAPLLDAAGRPRWLRPPTPENPAGVPLTLKLAADTYAVVIQAGAIAAVVILYWRQFVGILWGLLGRNSAGFRLLRNLLLACLPAAAMGLLAHDLIDRHFFSVPAVIVALVAGALLMFWAERWRRSNGAPPGAEPSDLTPAKSLGIGLAQCLALWPGTSRSMVTIVGGYLAGLSPVKAAEFSFVVGLPTLAGAALYKSFLSGPAMIEVFGWSSVLVGALVAAAAAAAAVKFLVALLTRRGLEVFAWYRLALAAVLALHHWL